MLTEPRECKKAGGIIREVMCESRESLLGKVVGCVAFEFNLGDSGGNFDLGVESSERDWRV